MEQDWARPVVHWEIQAKDPDTISNFYSTLFNWQIGDGRVRAIGPGIGAPEPTISGHILSGDAPRVVLYIQVLKLRESCDRAVELGGKIVREPWDLPQGQTVAWIEDPEGNRITLVQQ